MKLDLADEGSIAAFQSKYYYAFEWISNQSSFIMKICPIEMCMDPRHLECIMDELFVDCSRSV